MLPNPTIVKPSMVPHPAIAHQLPNGNYAYNVLRMVTGFYINKDHILVGDNVVYAPIPESTAQRIITPRSAILHSNAGPSATFWESLWKYWWRNDVTGEAHFQIPMKGKAVQVIPFNIRADCNAKANQFVVDGVTYGAISFETEDNGYETLDKTGWTIDQLGNMIGALVCLSVVYGMFCTPPAKWNDSGIGWHVLHPEWSIYKGKTCPGKQRIAQMPWIYQAVADKLAQFGKLTGWKCITGFN
jgi:hypothetical protein